MPRKAIVVLGMHRSGTSALTRALNLAGSFLPDRLLPPVPGENDQGFWEPARLVEADERALFAAGLTWDSPLGITPGWFSGPEAKASIEDLARVFSEDFGQHELVVIKDPRLCRLVPLAAAALRRCAIEPTYVLMLRHPRAVATSLAVRNAIPPGHGQRLWLRYMLDAERWTRGARRAIVGFDELLSDWKSTLARISNALGVDFSIGPDIEREVSRFLDPDSVHHAGEDEPLQPLVATAWSALCRMQTQRETTSLQEDLDRVASSLDQMEQLLAPTQKLRSGAPVMQRKATAPAAPASHEEPPARPGWLQGFSRKLAASGHFHARHYRTRYPEIKGEPAWHYWLRGRSEGRSPHPLFEPRYYARIADIEHLPPGRWFSHFLHEGEALGLSPHPLVDLRRLADGYGTGDRYLGLFARFSSDPAPPCNPHPLFDVRYYLQRYPDVAAEGINPLVHYLLHGALEGRQPSPCFDEAYYRARLDEPIPTGIAALMHFVELTGARPLSPTPRFDAEFFRACYPDGNRSGAQLLSQCLEMHGGRIPLEFSAWDGAQSCPPAPSGSQHGPLPASLSRQMAEDLFRFPAFWTLRVPRIEFAAAADTDLDAAVRLARSLRHRLPCHTVFSRHDVMDAAGIGTVDVIVMMSSEIDPVSLSGNCPRRPITIAWIRYELDRWIMRPWTLQYDGYWASTPEDAASLTERVSKPIELIPPPESPESELGRAVEASLRRLSERHACI